MIIVVFTGYDGIEDIRCYTFCTLKSLL